jgi:putative membrane protein
MTSIPITSLPAINAFLNGLSAVLLFAGYMFIRRGKMPYHRACMVSAFISSSIFLASYLYFHFHAGMVRFSGQGLVRPVYFSLLTTHTILAIVIVPMVLIALYRALTRQFIRHRAIARWTYPLWMYVSVTGVIIYWMLYRLYTPIYMPGIASFPR